MDKGQGSMSLQMHFRLIMGNLSIYLCFRHRIVAFVLNNDYNAKSAKIPFEEKGEQFIVYSR
jgi:hypothetical protein